MKLKEQKLELNSTLTYKIYKYYHEKSTFDVNAIIIIKFIGEHGVGSGGNKNSNFMNTIISASMGLFIYDDVILDFSDLIYTFGDSIGTPIYLPKKINKNIEEINLVVSSKCRNGLESLFKYINDPKKQINLYDSLEVCINKFKDAYNTP